MPQQTSLRNLTPPQYAATLEEKRQRVLLEERLAHFIDWLRIEHDVELALWTSGQQRRLTYEEMDSVVKEYVES